MEFSASGMIIGVFLVTLCHATTETMDSGEMEPNCVDLRLKELEVCFDPLVTKMVSEAPADINDFLCSVAKERLECVIQEFKKCPDFVNEGFLDRLKHDKGGFHAKDLFHVDSADEFCKCAPTNMCLEKIDIDSLGVDVDDSTWNRVANPAYICGIGRNHIDCVAKALPGCTDYLQHKHNTTVDDDMAHFDVTAVRYADAFAVNRCKKWPEDKPIHVCSEKRATWFGVKDCVEKARTYASLEHRECGLRICIEKGMHSCPEDDMGYYIDSVNVFSDVKVNPKPCTTSAASAVLATVITVMFTLCLSLYL